MEGLLFHLLKIPGIIIAVVIHEYIKALVSARLGDPLPREKGRLTLNPLKQMDAFGAICMLIWGYGWGNPVQTSPMYYRNRRRDTLITYIMPSLCNLFIGIVVGLAVGPLVSFIFAGNTALAKIFPSIFYVFHYIAISNISFALFNIVPIYPLDGAKVLSLFIPATAIIKMQQYEKVLQLILMFCIVLGFANYIFDPLVSLILGKSMMVGLL